MKNLLLLALVISATFAAKQPRFSFSEIQKYSFGSMILNAVQMNIKSGQDKRDVLFLLKEILAQLQASQESETEINAANSERCKDSVLSLNNQIENIQSTIQYLTASIEKIQTNVENEQNQLDALIDDLSKTTQNIENGEEDRRQVHSRWEENDEELSDQINQIEQLIQLLKHFENGVSFNQIKSEYTKLTSTLSKQKSNNSSIFSPLLASLLQFPNHLNTKHSTQLIALLNNLKSALEETQNEATFNENNSSSSWSVLVQQLETNKSLNSSLKDEYKFSIESSTILLQQQQTSRDKNLSFLEYFKEQLKNEKQICSDESSQNLIQAQEKQLSVNSHTFILFFLKSVKQIDLIHKLIEDFKENSSSFLELIK